jgi:hypothetical protein
MVTDSLMKLLIMQVYQNRLSWGALLFDMDNDGYKDIYVCNGIYHDLTNQDFVDFFANEFMQKWWFLARKNKSKRSLIECQVPPILIMLLKTIKLNFLEAKIGVLIYLVFQMERLMATDNDGDLDLIVNNVNMEAFVLEIILKE